MLATSLVFALAASALAQQNNSPKGFLTGACVSGHMAFDPARVFPLNNNETNRFWVDRTKYDFTLDYGNVTYANNVASLALTKNPTAGQPAFGTRLSTTTYFRYGRLTARFTPQTAVGSITTFITWSDVFQPTASGENTQDEIDWEILGKNTSYPESNVFTWQTKNLERGQHGGPITTAVAPGVAHNYTIDWRSDMIVWMVDNVPVRTLFKNQSKAAMPDSLPAGAAWFPTLASRVQISIWDGSTSSPGWAGGPLNWGNGNVLSSPFEFVEIQCYDDNNNPVDRWSTDGSGAPPTSTTGNPTGITPPPGALSSPSATSGSSLASGTAGTKNGSSPAHAASNSIAIGAMAIAIAFGAAILSI